MLIIWILLWKEMMFSHAKDVERFVSRENVIGSEADRDSQIVRYHLHCIPAQEASSDQVLTISI
jgi:hypothetical protein